MQRSTPSDPLTLCGYCTPSRALIPPAASPGIKCFGNILFYPHNGFLFGASNPGAVPPEPGKRGEIEGFSSSSASRFRRRLLQYVGTRPAWAITLTIRDFQSPERWRRCVDSFSKRVVRLGDSGFWRVELQKRGTPHLHCLAYTNNPSAWRDAWLAVWGVSDPDHKRFAVKFTSATGSGWLTYVATHATKHKSDQLGWLGRQWGIFNRSALVLRPFQAYTLPLAQYDVAIDAFRGWSLATGRYSPRWRYMCGYDSTGVCSDALSRSVAFAFSSIGLWVNSPVHSLLSFAVGIAPALGVCLPLSAHCGAF